MPVDCGSSVVSVSILYLGTFINLESFSFKGIRKPFFHSIDRENLNHIKKFLYKEELPFHWIGNFAQMKCQVEHYLSPICTTFSNRAASSWLKVAPFGLRRLMNWARQEYGDQWPIYITENGFSDYQGNLDDLHRVYYYKHYINQLLKGNP